MIRILVALVAFLPAVASAADTLTRDEVQSFKSVTQTLEGLSERYPDLEADLSPDPGEAMQMMSRMIGDDGKVRMFSMLMERVLEHPQFADEVRRAVGAAGFSSMASFTDIGNRVVAAMMRSETGPEELRQMASMGAMPESQLKMMPEGVREMARFGPLLARAMEDVPQEDVALVRELRPFE